MWQQVLKYTPHNLQHHICKLGGSMLVQITCTLNDTTASHALNNVNKQVLPLIICKPTHVCVLPDS